jgi:transposase
MMSGKSQQKLLTEFLNLPGVLVKAYRAYEGIGFILQLEAVQQQATCPRCVLKSEKLHQNHWYLVKDLPISSQPVYLRVNRRQWKCMQCAKPFSEELSYVSKNRTYTKRLAKEIVQQVLDNDIRSVAQRNDVSEEEIETMLKDIGAELLQEKPRELKRLGIDEIAWVKGQGNYCAVLVDLDSRKLLAIVKSRTQEDIRKVLNNWGQEILGQIEEVSIDLWKAYKILVEELMPNADVVADRFHVMKQVNSELDSMRKALRREAETINNSNKKEQMLAGIKKSKYALLKNEKDLNEQQKARLDLVKQVAPLLARMHQLKEEFRLIFEQAENWGEGLLKLLDWLKAAAPEFPETRKTIVRWLGEIVGYFERRTTQGVVEGINNKIKLIKRSAYGFRNFENFRRRTLLSWHFNC